MKSLINYDHKKPNLATKSESVKKLGYIATSV